jgi:hypothetical protein
MDLRLGTVQYPLGREEPIDLSCPRSPSLLHLLANPSRSILLAAVPSRPLQCRLHPYSGEPLCCLQQRRFVQSSSVGRIGGRPSPALGAWPRSISSTTLAGTRRTPQGLPISRSSACSWSPSRGLSRPTVPVIASATIDRGEGRRSGATIKAHWILDIQC